ncbi:MAG: HDOD domain-containing protein [Candidatus Zixiibacteriota bacterium]|nr:MAG: HDOD domain-containing protein [candidate division Zixibacteria bacterium]
MARISAEDVVSAVREIGVLPQTMVTILRAFDNPDASTKDIAAVINRDISLTTRVLRMVNSVRYGRSRKVTRVSEAVRVMGLNSIKVLTLSSSIFGIKPDEKLFGQLNIKRIWRHFIETAVSASNIASECGYPDPEEAFIAGILHDIGIVLMLLHFRERYVEVVRGLEQNRKGIVSAEKELLGFTHCEVGAQIAEGWKLPPRLIHVIRNHHDINSPAIIHIDAMLNDIIATADRIALGPFDYSSSGVEEDILFTRKACAKLKMKSRVVNQIRKSSLMQSIELAKYLELDAGDIIDILADASNRLADLYYSLEQALVEESAMEEEVKSAAPVAAASPQQ